MFGHKSRYRRGAARWQAHSGGRRQRARRRSRRSRSFRPLLGFAIIGGMAMSGVAMALLLGLIDVV